MMSDLTTIYDNEPHNFVEPYEIEELGCDGLLASDIAKSLKIPATEVRRKLKERGFLERIKSQGFQAMAIAMTNDINNLQFEELALDTAAAKFFVGKYDSPTGDSYLAFLLKLEQMVCELDAEIKSDSLLQAIAHTMTLRRRQLLQEKRIKEQEEKTKQLESKTLVIEEHLLESQLTQSQKKRLKDLIDAKANACGSIKFAGVIQKDLKSHFELNATNDKWYHLAQRNYESACIFVERWGRQ
jgi:leucyl aminopeptidase